MLILILFVFVIPTSCRTVATKIEHTGKAKLEFKGKQKDSGIAPNPSTPEGLAEFAQVLNASLNSNLQPCQDFYNYVCGNEKYSTVEKLQVSVINTLVTGLQKIPSTPALSKLQALLDKCVKYKTTPNPDDYNGVKFLQYYDKLKQILGVDLPIFNENPVPKPSKQQLTEAMYFFSTLGMQTLITAKVSLNSQRRTSEEAVNTIMFQPPNILFGKEIYYYYREKWNDKGREGLARLLATYVHIVAEAKKEKVNQERLKKDTNDVVNYDFLIGGLMPNPQLEHLNEMLLAKTMTAKEADNAIGLIDFPAFLQLFVKDESDALKRHVLADTFTFLVKAPESMVAFKKLWDSDQSNGRTIVNHLYLNLFFHLKSRLASQKPPTPAKDDFLFGKRSPLMFDESLSNSSLDEKGQCLNALATYAMTPQGFLTDLFDRVYVETALPTQEIRQNKVNYVAEFTKNIIDGFRTQLDELNWTPASKQKAYDKIANIKQNLVYAEKIFNDTYLNDKYASYKLNDALTYEDEMARLQELLFSQQKLSLIATNKDREYMLAISQVNAFYSPETNAIIIVNGLLHPPLFNMGYPLSAVYGGVGSVLGHEIVHGYDNLGVHFDKNGDANPWLDAESKGSFDSMAQCVVKQYNGLPTTYKLPINGEATQGENIADAGGLLASYRAFKAHASKVGSDPPLPIPNLQSITSDQLFFISSAMFHCQKPPHAVPETYADMHTENPSRVLGMLQNTPEFKTAFNCKTGDLYAPKEYCNVYRKAEPKPPC